MKDSVRKWCVGISLAILLPTAGWLDYYNRTHSASESLHPMVVEGFGVVCVRSGVPFLKCTCIIDQAENELTTDSFHQMNLRVFGGMFTPEDKDRLRRWDGICMGAIESAMEDAGEWIPEEPKMDEVPTIDM